MPDTWGQEKKLQSKMLILNLFGAFSKIFRDALSFGRAYCVMVKVLFLEDMSPISFQINKKKRWETKVVSIKEVWLSPQKLFCPRCG